LQYNLLFMDSLPPLLASTLAQLEWGLRQLYGDRFRGLLLYGSYARGEADEGSDVDLLVLLEGPVNVGREIWRIGAVTSPLSLDSGYVFSTLPLSIEDYGYRDSLFLRTVRKEAIAAA
jgi:predicted nucleotidyltransferase